MIKNYFIRFVVIILFSLGFFQVLYSQEVILRFRVTALTAKFKINNYKWGEWEDWEKTDALGIMTDRRVTIYTKSTQTYDIAKYNGKSLDEDGDEAISMYCVNEDGLVCDVNIVTRNSNVGERELYIVFEVGAIIGYKIEILPK